MLTGADALLNGTQRCLCERCRENPSDCVTVREIHILLCVTWMQCGCEESMFSTVFC